MTSFQTELEQNAVGMKSTVHNLAGVQARAGERHLTQGSCEAGVATEGKQPTPGWDKHFGGTSWWSEGSHPPNAAGTTQTNWSLSEASMQAPI